MHESQKFSGRDAFPEDWVKIVEPIAKNLAARFLFGSYTVSDLVQHSYMVVLNESYRFNPERGKFHAFAKTLIHSRLHSLKRDKYERHDPPCNKCPLKAILAANKQSCSEYDTLESCPHYSKWKIKNEAKRLLSCSHAECSDRQGSLGADVLVENQDLFEWLLLIVSDTEGLEALRRGEHISDKRRKALMDEIAQCLDEDDNDA